MLSGANARKSVLFLVKKNEVAAAIIQKNTKA
jgi:hypothetical protein